MSKIITSLNYFNPDGCVSQDEKIIGSNGTGFVDFNKPKYKWSTSIYKLMQDNTWFIGEVDTSEEKKNFSLLSDNEKEIYKLTFAQLSFNDSAQEAYLSDFRSLSSNSLVKSALSLQMYQESLHSQSYATLLDAAGNSEEIFNMYKTNSALYEKNKEISEQFAMSISGTTSDKMLTSAMASINLEGIYFLLGFSYIYTLGDKIPGSRDMIQFIARDELNTHAPLFVNIFKTIRNENNIDTKTVDIAYSMIKDAVDIEIKYGKYLFENYPILGLSIELIENTVYNFANQRLKSIGLDEIFPKTQTTYLQQLVTKHLNLNQVRSNFFESNVKNYSKGSIEMEF